MKAANDRTKSIAISLVVFLVVVGITIWLLDFVAQQRVFGLLVGAELVAFALLVGIFYEENPKDISRKWLAGGFTALAVLVLLAAILLVGVGSIPAPSVKVTLYAGEISTTEYGFGNSPTTITSPGPTLAFKVGDIVNLTVVNMGKMPHNWALTTTNQISASVLFGARIATGEVPIPPNQIMSTVFTVSKAGNFLYLCEVSGHLQLGMWGKVVITS